MLGLSIHMLHKNEPPLPYLSANATQERWNFILTPQMTWYCTNHVFLVLGHVVVYQQPDGTLSELRVQCYCRYMLQGAKAHVVRTQINKTGSHAPAVGSRSQNQAISLNIKKKKKLWQKKIKNTKTMLVSKCAKRCRVLSAF